MKLSWLLPLLVACHGKGDAAQPAIPDESDEAGQVSSDGTAEPEPASEAETGKAGEIARGLEQLLADMPNDFASFRGELIRDNGDGSKKYAVKGTELIDATEEYFLETANGAFLYGARWKDDDVAPAYPMDAVGLIVAHGNGAYEEQKKFSPPTAPPRVEIAVTKNQRGILQFIMDGMEHSTMVIVGTGIPNRH